MALMLLGSCRYCSSCGAVTTSGLPATAAGTAAACAGCLGPVGLIDTVSEPFEARLSHGRCLHGEVEAAAPADAAWLGLLVAGAAWPGLEP